MAVVSVVTSVRRGHRGLYVFAVVMAIATLLIAAAAVVDQRTLLGQPLWLKPLKFAVSFALYAGALSWLLSRLTHLSRPVNIAAWLIASAGTVEMAIIIGQAARGEQSHFNSSNSLGILLYAVMGITIVTLYAAAIGISVAVIRQPGSDRVVVRAVTAGLLIALLGLTVGFVMVAIGAHAVGVPDGGPGLPLVGWSTTGGDLRIGHFVGMHALQLLPLGAAGITALGRDRWDEQTQLKLVSILAAGYTAVVGLVTWQALRAQPLTSPDALTIVVALAIAVVTGVTTASAISANTSRVPA